MNRRDSRQIRLRTEAGGKMGRRCNLVPVFLLIAAAMPVRAVAAGNAAPQASPGTAAAPIQVTVWTWIIRVGNMNYPADELPIDMYVTFTYDLRFKDKINPMKHFEIIEAKSVEKYEEDEEARPEQGVYWQSFRCNAVIERHWHIDSFPFHQHPVRMTIEDSVSKAGTLVYVADPDSGREEISVRMISFARSVKSLNIGTSSATA
jgi:hypothetical protein